MTEAHLPAVLRIERAAYAYPWTERHFQDSLRGGHSCWIAQARQDLCGYGLLLIAAGECQVLNLCIAPAFQRQGLGRRLMRHLMATAWRQGAERILLEARVGNQAAIRLYRGLGFAEVGRRKGYYPADTGREDALVFVKNGEDKALRRRDHDMRSF